MAIFEEMERENEKLEKQIERERKNKFEDIANEVYEIGLHEENARIGGVGIECK